MPGDSADQSKMSGWILNALQEVGLVSLFHASVDTKLLCLQRFIRLFAYGASTLVLVPYLNAVGTSDTDVGLFMTLTLIGDFVISFFLALFADGLGRRKTLALGALLMCASGFVFASTGNYWALLAAAIFGVITPSGNEIGPFRAVEESTIAQLTSVEHRSDIFAWYALIGSGGTALGLMTCGWVTSSLIKSHRWSIVETYRLVFFSYAIVGFLKFILALLLSAKCEAERQPPRPDATETTPILQNEAVGPESENRRHTWLPQLGHESKAILVPLCMLFAFDNLGSGLAPLSWVTFYFKSRFGLAEGEIGTLFFATSIISAFSILVASSVAKRIGNVKTMVFTHLPSSICLALIGIPSSLPLAMIFVILRACTQSMDVAPRSAFLAAVVLPNERTAVMGIVNLVKSISQSFGPLITGILVQRKLFWVAFLMAGCLKASYDIGMLLIFAGYNKSKDENIEDTAESRPNQNAIQP
ncbi:MFS general substrate transporter [Myriangium duriaei CBS 260.36]|uniref:MFS general substrate transporter n=1 Tax=Myriangium duriaei CBS 260.36 TaxID=1168546 RepID=A0A9P4IYG3_9PEZI|nr:MFS general substrate transporter [Myriangium duriaei CBS 260.36]